MIGPFVGFAQNGKGNFTSFMNSGAFVLTGSIAPTALSGSVNDYNPTGLSTCNLIRQDASVNSTITGIAAQTTGQELVIQNLSATNTITLSNESVSSSANNRFTFPNSADWVIPPYGAVWVRYSGTALRWRVVNSPSATEALSAISVTSLTNSGALKETGFINPTGLTGTLNDWAPIGFSGARYVYATSANTGAITVTGIAGGVDGMVVTIIGDPNNTSGNGLTISHESASSLAANRLTLTGSVSASLNSTILSAITIRYNGATQRWQQVGFDSTSFGFLPAFTAGLVVSGASLILSNVVTPSALASGSTNNWNPTAGFRYRVTPASGGSTVTGLLSGVSSGLGRVSLIENIATANGDTITLTHNDSNSTAANRFLLPNGQPYVIRPGEAVPIIYDTTDSSWRLFAGEQTQLSTQADTSTGTVSDYALQSGVGILRLNPASALTLTGISGGVDGRMLYVVNVSTTATVVLAIEAAGSSAANRLLTIGGNNLNLSFVGANANAGALLIYDGTSSRWRVLSAVTSSYTTTVAFGAGLLITGAHVRAIGTTPTITSGGGSSPTITGSDVAFRFVPGTGASGTVITFATTYTNAPIVICSSENGVLPTFTVSATAITLGGTITATNGYHFHVIGVV